MIYEWLSSPILCLRLFGWQVMLKQCRAICLVSLLPNDPSVLSKSLHSKSRKFHLPIVYQMCLKLVMFLSEVQHQIRTLFGEFFESKTLPWNDENPYGKVVGLVLSLGQSSYPWLLPWKSMVGRCISYWNSPFLGDMLVFRGVFRNSILAHETSIPSKPKRPVDHLDVLKMLKVCFSRFSR